MRFTKPRRLFLCTCQFQVEHRNYPSTSNRRSRSLTVRRNYAPKAKPGSKKNRTMDSLGCVSPSIVLPHNTGAYHRTRRRQLVVSSSWFSNHHLHRMSSSFPAMTPLRVRVLDCKCKMNGGGVEDRGDGEKEGEEEVEQALHLDGTIPSTSGEFVKQVSSRAYDMRRHLQQSFDSSSYDVLETNPWREDPKPVYVLTHKINQLCTMKTRRNRSEVERELGLLFSKGGKRRPGLGSQSQQQSRSGTKFQMLVEDVREGVLVFEDENDAASYCDLLQGGGRGCEGVAEVEASSVFDLCSKMRALAVLFRRGRKPPLPQSLELSLRARKRSLEDQEYLH